MPEATVSKAQHTPQAIFTLVDGFLATEIEARALSLALRWGWIDSLAAAGKPANPIGSGIPPAGRDLLIALLRQAGVLGVDEPPALTDRFREALLYRDLLEARLWFAALVAKDVHDGLEDLLTDVQRFMAGARTFELFRYDRCFEITPENIEATRRWVDYTTVLTRYEAPAALTMLDLSDCRSLLDVGGNSGEFAKQACQAYPDLSATVFDLPVVCAIGREHLAGAAVGSRIGFQPGDLRRDALPAGHDAILFKSVLHDWPEPAAAALLDKAWTALAPGGVLAIFERVAISPRQGRFNYADVANLVFLAFYRDPAIYRDRLAAIGFAAIEQSEVAIDMPFVLTVARKPT